MVTILGEDMMVTTLSNDIAVTTLHEAQQTEQQRNYAIKFFA